MMYVLYDIALHALVVFLSPYFVFKMITAGKYRRGIAERFGFIGPAKASGLEDGPVVWVHAVSVGETRAVLPVVKLFKERNPGARVVFSTVTITGNEVAAAEGSGLVDALIYFPLDLSWVVRRVARLLNPSVFIVVEKEIWPNCFHAMERAGVPVLVVNGTISEKTFRRYKRFRPVFGPVLASISAFCARTEADRRRAVESGVRPERAATLGNLKFDLSAPAIGRDRRAALARALGIGPGDLLVVAGSTHEGEEAMLIEAFRSVAGEVRGVKLVIAPRHPERFDEVEGLLKRSGLEYARRSAGGKAPVVLLDTVGELMAVYSFASVAFVGGSLVEGIGGHNLLEPAYYGHPVVYGDRLTTYALMAEMLEEAGGGVRVKDAGSLAETLKRLLTDEVERKRTGEAARSVVEANRGASLKTVEVIESFLPGGKRRPGQAAEPR